MADKKSDSKFVCCDIEISNLFQHIDSSKIKLQSIILCQDCLLILCYHLQKHQNILLNHISACYTNMDGVTNLYAVYKRKIRNPQSNPIPNLSDELFDSVVRDVSWCKMFATESFDQLENYHPEFFTPIINIFNICSILLKQANTASYFIQNCSKSIILLVSITVYILVKLQLNEENHDIFYSFGKFIKLLVAHSTKFNDKWYQNMKQFHSEFDASFVAEAVGIILRILNKKYIVNNDKRFCKKYVIMPLIIFMRIFEKELPNWQFIRNVINTMFVNNKWLFEKLYPLMDYALFEVCERNDESDLPFLIHVHFTDMLRHTFSKDVDEFGIMQISENGFYKTYSDGILNKYLRITILKEVDCYFKYFKPKGMRYKDLECQWKYCKKTKKSTKKRDWKKCKGCKMARYCCKRHQKLDWNKGKHKQICKLFI